MTIVASTAFSTGAFSNLSSTVVTRSRAEEAKLAREKKQLADTRQAIQTLAAMKTDAKEERKALAKRRVEQIKQQIKMLEMTASSDPARTAKIAAQLSRELASAVKAYAAAGGASGDLGGGAASSSTAGSASPSEAATSAEAGTEAAPAAATSQQVAVVETENNAASSDADGSDPKATTDPYRKSIEAARPDNSERDRRRAEAQGDRDFLTEVKGLAERLKALIRQAANQIEISGDPDDAKDVEDAEKALKTVEQEIASATRSLNVGGGVSLVV